MAKEDIDLRGLKPEHFDAMEKVAEGKWSVVDGRLLRPLTRRGFVKKNTNGTFSILNMGKRALEMR